MANGLPLLFESVTIADNGNGASSVTINLVDDDNITIGNEPLETLVEAGESIVDAFDQNMEIITYDLGALDDVANTGAYIQTNSTLTTNTADVTVNGKSGSVDVAITGVRASAIRPFNDLNRDHSRIKVTKRSTSGITVTNA